MRPPDTLRRSEPPRVCGPIPCQARPASRDRSPARGADMTEDRDYLLGTHDAEVRRLGHQHRVWRPRVLDAWRRAGIKTGSTVIDAGSGPGWASLDLAEIVGDTGRVIALERSARFSEIMMSSATQRGFG